MATLCVGVAQAAVVLQADLEGDTDGFVTQAGWSQVQVTGAGTGPVFKDAGTTPNVLITAGGATGWLTGRSGGIEFNDLPASFDDADMQGDLVAARSGDGTVAMAFTGLTAGLDYTLTVWHNAASDANGSFSLGQTRRW